MWQVVQGLRPPRIQLASLQFFPASLLRNRSRAPGGLPRPQDQTGQDALDPQGQPIHLAVRAGGHDPGTGDAGAGWGPHHRGQRHATLAGGPVLRGPGSVQNGPGRGQGVVLDEANSKRSYNYATVFIDLDRKQKPVIFDTPGKRAVWFCSTASCVSIAAVTTISPRWSATCRQPPWPRSAKASPAPTLP
ncbi:hypothetical protein DFAR_330004 [Desulfarculales bacterium]